MQRGSDTEQRFRSNQTNRPWLGVEFRGLGCVALTCSKGRTAWRRVAYHDIKSAARKLTTAYNLPLIPSIPEVFSGIIGFYSALIATKIYAFTRSSKTNSGATKRVFLVIPKTKTAANSGVKAVGLPDVSVYAS